MTQHATTTPVPTRPGQLSEAEFIPLMAAMTAIGAMAIDGMLPALGQIGRDLQVAHANDAQLVISSIFGGMIFGGLLGGPLSDSFGRKRAIYFGLALFILGSALCAMAPTFYLLLAGRVLQGLGASIPAVVSIALVRDLYSGDAMGRIMSFAMSVFILVPVLAPMFGQGVLLFGGWRLIFWCYCVIAVLIGLWIGLRQPETLAIENRKPFRLTPILAAAREVVTNRPAMGFALAAGIMFGSMLGYLSTAQQMFQDLYGVGTAFPFYFGSLAAGVGIAMFVNGTLVMRFGMKRLTNFAFTAVAGLSLAFLPIVWATSGKPPLWAMMGFLAMTFLSFGALLGNLNALSMRALGHIAGVASAVLGSMRTGVATLLGLVIGRAFDGTVLPLVLGFAVLGCSALALAQWAERGEHRLAEVAP
jgi:MFS transporter, DHA1 family, multidrug resistance protein